MKSFLLAVSLLFTVSLTAQSFPPRNVIPVRPRRLPACHPGMLPGTPCLWRALETEGLSRLALSLAVEGDPTKTRPAFLFVDLGRAFNWSLVWKVEVIASESVCNGATREYESKGTAAASQDCVP